MSSNDYGGLVEQWKVDLIASRARRLGIRRHDLEDAQQEIILDVLTFEHRGKNGATLATALTSLIDRRLKAMLRSRRRYQEHLDAIQRQSEEVADGEIARIHLSKDVQVALAQLSPRHRAICAGIAEGKTWETIATELGCGWHTVRRAVERIRDHLSARNLDCWIVK